MAEQQVIILDPVTGKKQVFLFDFDNIVSGVPNIEGGVASSVYTPDQCYSGGDASGN